MTEIPKDEQDGYFGGKVTPHFTFQKFFKVRELIEGFRLVNFETLSPVGDAANIAEIAVDLNDPIGGSRAKTIEEIYSTNFNLLLRDMRIANIIYFTGADRGLYLDENSGSLIKLPKNPRVQHWLN